MNVNECELWRLSRLMAEGQGEREREREGKECVSVSALLNKQKIKYDFVSFFLFLRLLLTGGTPQNIYISMAVFCLLIFKKF